MKKVCSKCGKEKSIEDFTKDKYKKGGRTSSCKKCRNKYGVEYRRRVGRKDKTSTRNSNLKMMYGITVEDWDKMFERQKGKCAVCGKHQSELKTRLCVDHDHTTLEVRSLLCSNCNVMIGYAKEDIGVLLKAAEYLKKHV